MECSFILLPCLMGSSRVVPLDACSKESRGARVASRKDLWWDHKDNNKNQQQQQQQLDNLLRNVFLQFRAQLHFYHKSFGFWGGGGDSAKALLQEERDNSLKLSMLWRIYLRT